MINIFFHRCLSAYSVSSLLFLVTTKSHTQSISQYSHRPTFPHKIDSSSSSSSVYVASNATCRCIRGIHIISNSSSSFQDSLALVSRLYFKKRYGQDKTGLSSATTSGECFSEVGAHRCTQWCY